MASNPSDPADPMPDDAGDDGDLRVLLVVTGAALEAEVEDRPKAYQLAQRIHAWQDQQAIALTDRVEPVVCSDLWYLNQQDIGQTPTISVGSPDRNALAAYFAQRVEAPDIEQEQTVIQFDPEFVDLQASVWGTNEAMTSQAIEIFCGSYLDPFMRAVLNQVEPEE